MKNVLERPTEPKMVSKQAAPKKAVATTTAAAYNAPGATAGGIFGNALSALWSNRQRSILTMLGIVIGIAAFIGVVTLSLGTSASFTDRFEFMATIITVNPSHGSKITTPFQLTGGDVQALAKLSHVVNVSPTISSSAEVIYSNQTWSTSMQGVSSGYQEMQGQNLLLSSGTWWSDQEEQSRRFDVVLGDTVAKNVFGATDPIGQTVRIDRQLYHVVGVLQPSGQSRADDVVYVPYTVVLNPNVVNQIQAIQVQTDSTSNLDLVQTEMQVSLEQRHHILPGGHDGFDITQNLAQLQQNEQFLGVLSTMMICIATFSLVVGGVGIMNIMLVSVTERTREIGLRAALGAQPWDICFQFLLEALTLSFIGGALGLLFGLGMAYAITSLVHFAFILNTNSFLLAFGVSTAIGVGFGLYPAIRASRLDPIVALRSA